METTIDVCQIIGAVIGTVLMLVLICEVIRICHDRDDEILYKAETPRIIVVACDDFDYEVIRSAIAERLRFAGLERPTEGRALAEICQAWSAEFTDRKGAI